MLRLRFTRQGWFRFAFAFESGYYDLRTKQRIPDEYGCFRRDVWVGPFPNAGKAADIERIATRLETRKPTQ